MSQLDALLASDLAAVADDNRRHPLPIAGVYRDDRPGIAARRDAAVAERSRELAVMPLVLAHVFAHRIGRAGAGAASVCAALIVPMLNAFTSMGFVLAAVLACYIGATAVAQRVFERRLRDAISVTDDARADLDRLAEGPIELARRMIRRADGWAVALGIAGTVAVLALVGFSVSIARVATPTHHLALLVGAFLVALAWAAAVGRACDREHRGQVAGWLGVFGHLGTLGLGVVLGVGVLFAGLDAARVARISHVLPTTASRAGMVAVGTAGPVLIATWLWLWWRRREHARIAD